MTERIPPDTSSERESFPTLTTAARYARVKRQALHLAIKKGRLKAERHKFNGRESLKIFKQDLDDYRASKYNRTHRRVQGQMLFSMEEDRWSVLLAAKVLGEMLGRPYHPSRIYYLLRKGILKGYRLGGAWVLKKEDLMDVFHREVARAMLNESSM